MDLLCWLGLVGFSRVSRGRVGISVRVRVRLPRAKVRVRDYERANLD